MAVNPIGGGTVASVYSVAGQPGLMTSNIGQLVPGLVGSQNVTAFSTQIGLKGQPISGVKVEPGTKTARYMPDNIVFSSLSTGDQVEFQAGVIVDMVDVSATAIPAGDYTISTPHGDTVDLLTFIRLRNDPQQMYALPAGKYTITATGATPGDGTIAVHMIQSDEL